MHRLLPLLLLLPLAGCSASASVSAGKTVDETKIEAGIGKALEDEIGIPIGKVSCPDDIRAKAGTTFKCDVEGKDGTKVVSTGKITAEKRYEASTPVINTTKVQDVVVAGIKEQAGADVEVDCPDLVQLKAGAKSTCKATLGDDSRDVSITQKDDTGNVSYRLE